MALIYKKRKLAMISQPMNGKSKDEIEATRAEAEKHLESLDYDVINSWFKDEFYNDADLAYKNGIKNDFIWFLAKSLDAMSKCDAVYFCKDWEYARGCRIEHRVATDYGMEVMYEEDLEAKDEIDFDGK